MSCPLAKVCSVVIVVKKSFFEVAFEFLLIKLQFHYNIESCRILEIILVSKYDFMKALARMSCAAIFS